MTTSNTKIFHSKAFQSIPKFEFLVPKNLAILFSSWSKYIKAALVDPISHSDTQGCQMVYFQTKNTNLGKFWGP
jgi:hypothetical protein